MAVKSPPRPLHMSDVVASPPPDVVVLSTATLGTSTTSSLNPALVFSSGMLTATYPQDVGAIANAILDDLNPAHPIYPGAFAQNGLLYVPNRGVLRVLPGDYVGIDPQGWPILVSANSIAGTGWTHT